MQNLTEDRAQASRIRGETSRHFAARPAYEQCNDMPDAIRRAHAMREGCEEIKAKAAEVEFHDNDGELVVTVQKTPFEVSNFFMQQVGAVTNVGLALQEKLSTATLVRVLNETWQVEGEKRFLIRDGKHLRGFVGERYERLWDQQIVDAADSWLRGSGLFIPAVPTINTSFARRNPDGSSKPALFIGDRSSHFFFYTEKGEGGLRTGITMNNSEVGFCVFDWSTFVFRDMCANFLIWEPAHVRQTRARHTKNAIKKGWSHFIDDLSHLTSEVSPTIVATLERAKTIIYGDVPRRVDRSFEARAERLGRDLLDVTREEHTVRKITRSTGLSVDQARRGLEAARLPRNSEASDPYSLFAIVQGITDAAKDEEFQDGMLAMSEKGSSLLSLAEV